MSDSTARIVFAGTSPVHLTGGWAYSAAQSASKEEPRSPPEPDLLDAVEQLPQDLLQVAFTSKEEDASSNLELSEYLGDPGLRLYATRTISDLFPHLTLHERNALREASVNRASLSELAVWLGLHRYLLRKRHAVNQTLLEDSFEAVVGVMIEVRGHDATEAWVKRVMRDLLKRNLDFSRKMARALSERQPQASRAGSAAHGGDGTAKVDAVAQCDTAKSRLRNLCVSYDLAYSYEPDLDSGAADGQWTEVVKVDDVVRGRGTASKRKDAAQLAAQDALDHQSAWLPRRSPGPIRSAPTARAHPSARLSRRPLPLDRRHADRPSPPARPSASSTTASTPFPLTSSTPRPQLSA